MLWLICNDPHIAVSKFPCKSTSVAKNILTFLIAQTNLFTIQLILTLMEL